MNKQGQELKEGDTVWAVIAGDVLKRSKVVSIKPHDRLPWLYYCQTAAGGPNFPLPFYRNQLHVSIEDAVPGLHRDRMGLNFSLFSGSTQGGVKRLTRP